MNAWIAPTNKANGFQISSPPARSVDRQQRVMTETISTLAKMLPKSRRVSVIGLVISSMMLIGSITGYGVR